MKQSPKSPLSLLLIVLQGSFVLLVLCFFYFLFEKPVQHQTRVAQQRAMLSMPEPPVDPYDRVENGIHVFTGLAYDENFQLVNATCTACHSAKLITQNKATRDGWLQMIRWMQETQGLHELGASEKPILDYLAKHYAPTEVSRRPNINVEEIEWYVLNLEG